MMCSYFWHHMCVRPDFKVKPCCRFDMANYSQSKNLLPRLADYIGKVDSVLGVHISSYIPELSELING